MSGQDEEARGRGRGRGRPRDSQSVGPEGRGGRVALDPSALAKRLQTLALDTPGVRAAGPSDATATEAEGSVGRGYSREGKRVVEEQAQGLRTRPEHVTSKRGSCGAKIRLTANYFKVKTHMNWRLYQYRVDFHPETDQTVVKKGLLRVHKEMLGGYIFDGTVMFTSSLLSQDKSKIIELFSKRSDDVNIKISIRLVGDLAEGDYHYLQFFNILMRKCLQHLKLQLVGRNYFDATAKIEIPSFQLQLWPGYITSIRQHEDSILMCAEITHKVMRNDTVLNLLAELIRGGDRDYRRTFQQRIIGAIVLTDYNNRTYRVDDVDFNVTPNGTFKLHSGTEISYKDYYMQKYQIRITQNDQPLLITRTKPREQLSGKSSLVYLIPELCRLTGLTDNMRSDFALMRALADHTRVGPRNRVDKLLRFGQRLTQEQAIAKDLEEWDMRLARNLVKLDGRVLQNESIIQAGPEKYLPSVAVDWTKELRSKQLLLIPELYVWATVCPVKIIPMATSFVSALQKAAAGMRFRMPLPLYWDIQDDRAGTYIDAIEKVINRANPELIVIVVPNSRADRYSSIKKKCCVDRAVSSQVILAKNLNAKGLMSIATKVAIQICCKIGGAPWSVDIPLSGLMVVGFDVCHDKSSKGKSYGAMVASMDKALARYFTAVSAHTTGEELSNDLSINLSRAVQRFTTYNNGALPSRIVVYRDGVGDGQIPYVYEHEVALVRKALDTMYSQTGATLKLAYVIVNKRINTRFFLKNDNPPPGTVVDDCVTMPQRYDFFLVSQTVRQGTVSPTYFNVISDNVGLDPEKMQRLTYKLTHLYYNWSGTVRVPAPCQYAHKLAYLVGQVLHCPPNSDLDDYLYFL